MVGEKMSLITKSLSHSLSKVQGSMPREKECIGWLFQYTDLQNPSFTVHLQGGKHQFPVLNAITSSLDIFVDFSWLNENLVVHQHQFSLVDNMFLVFVTNPSNEQSLH